MSITGYFTLGGEKKGDSFDVGGAETLIIKFKDRKVPRVRLTQNGDDVGESEGGINDDEVRIRESLEGMIVVWMPSGASTYVRNSNDWHFEGGTITSVERVLPGDPVKRTPVPLPKEGANDAHGDRKKKEDKKQENELKNTLKTMRSILPRRAGKKAPKGRG
jgi:hypothetical protein